MFTNQPLIMEQCSRKYQSLLDSVVRRRRRRRRAGQLLKRLRRFTEPDGMVALASLKRDALRLAKVDDFLDEVVLVLHNYLFSANENVVKLALDVVTGPIARHCYRLKLCNMEHLITSLLRTLRQQSPAEHIFLLTRCAMQQLLQAEPEMTTAVLGKVLRGGSEEASTGTIVEIYVHLISYILTSEEIFISVLDRLVSVSIRSLLRDSMAHRFCAFEALYALHYRYLSLQDMVTYAEEIGLPAPLVEALRRRLQRRYVPPFKADRLVLVLMSDADFDWISRGGEPM
ncbi:uncharacterized protein LOC135365995 [Ornithodoros turicata]|uniref:uncharacterized protein LOC135365995 n=1 Tax=Ornithodoros turicata TaxID=34597 RepID=UPI00313A4AC7